MGDCCGCAPWPIRNTELQSVEIENHICLHRPPEPGTNLTLLLLHGTGGNERDLLPLAEAIAPGAGRLSVRGRVLENGMPRFFRRHAEGVFDLEDLALRTRELAAFLRAARSRLAISEPLTALGYSNGANIAASLLLTDPSDLAAAILLRPMMPFEPQTQPQLHNRRILIASGAMDPICPPDHAGRLKAAFERFGAEVVVEMVPAAHALMQQDLDLAAAWLRR